MGRKGDHKKNLFYIDRLDGWYKFKRVYFLVDIHTIPCYYRPNNQFAGMRKEVINMTRTIPLRVVLTTYLFF
ncbi:MAG: hypothetical protein IJ274_01535 [Lachnospiraceae bacterium]|nr:hypothetical protein [Lachnospiraceae bacterium]